MSILELPAVAVYPGAVAVPTPDPGRQAVDPAPVGEGPLERLAALGRAGGRAARKALAEAADLDLAERRQQVATDRVRTRRTERACRRAERRERLERMWPPVVYVLAVAFAVGGQVSVFATALHLVWWVSVPVAVGAAGLVEGSGLALAIRSRTDRLAGEHATVARAMAWVCAVSASTINAVGHAGTPWVYPTAGGSLLAILLWEVESAATVRTRLREIGLIDPVLPRLGWYRLRHPHTARLARAIALRDPARRTRAACLAAARAEQAIRTVVARDVTATAGPGMADLVLATIDPDQLTTLVHDALDPVGLVRDALTAHTAITAPSQADSGRGDAGGSVAAVADRGGARPAELPPAHRGGGGGAGVDHEPGGRPGDRGGADRARRTPRTGRRSAARPAAERAHRSSTDGRLTQAWQDLAARLGRDPSGAELALKAGTSKSTANEWKARRSAA